MHRATSNAALASLRSQPAAARGGRTVVVEEVEDPCGDRDNRKVEDQACATPWTSSRGLPRAMNPGSAPCGIEYSQHILRGRRPLHSIYSDCEFEITEPDAPNDDLGVVANFRDVLTAGLLVSPGDINLYTAAFANPTTTVTATIAGCGFIGGFFKLNFQFALTQTLSITLAITNVVTQNGVSCARSIGLMMREGCTSAEFFLPLAASEQGGTLWAPRVGLTTLGPPATILTVGGLPANAGVVSAKFVSVNDPIVQRVIGAINNA